MARGIANIGTADGAWVGECERVRILCVFYFPSVSRRVGGGVCVPASVFMDVWALPWVVLARCYASEGGRRVVFCCQKFNFR
jgi:hypothetical protein